MKNDPHHFTRSIISILKVAAEEYKRRGYIPTIDLLVEDLQETIGIKKSDE